MTNEKPPCGSTDRCEGCPSFCPGRSPRTEWNDMRAALRDDDEADLQRRTTEWNSIYPEQASPAPALWVYDHDLHRVRRYGFSTVYASATRHPGGSTPLYVAPPAPAVLTDEAADRFLTAWYGNGALAMLDGPRRAAARDSVRTAFAAALAELAR